MIKILLYKFKKTYLINLLFIILCCFGSKNIYILYFLIIAFLILFSKYLLLLKKIPKEERKQIEIELKSPEFFSKYYWLLKNYIIDYMNMKVIKYEDIKYMYVKIGFTGPEIFGASGSLCEYLYLVSDNNKMRILKEVLSITAIYNEKNIKKDLIKYLLSKNKKIKVVTYEEYKKLKNDSC